MIKKLLISAVIAFAPLAAFAASFTNIEFQNGDVTIQGTGGTVVTAKVRLVIPANQVVEKVQTDVLGDNLGPVCVDVGGDKGLEEGTHYVNLDFKLPPNTGTYSAQVQGSGIYGAFKTVDCTSDVVAPAMSFTNALKVVSNSSNSSSSSSSNDSAPAWLSALLAQIQANMAALIAALKPVVPPTPAPGTGGAGNPICSQLLSAQAGGTSALQGFLMAHGQASPFHAIGVYSPTGFYGSATIHALSMFKTENSCWGN